MYDYGRPKIGRDACVKEGRSPDRPRRFRNRRSLQAFAAASAFTLHNALTAHVDCTRLRNAEPIRELAVIFAIKDGKVSELAAFERADFLATV